MLVSSTLGVCPIVDLCPESYELYLSNNGAIVLVSRWFEDGRLWLICLIFRSRHNSLITFP